MTRVLIIDDDAFDRILFQRRLLDVAPDWSIHEAPDLTTGLRRLGQVPFDLVVTDLALPEADGVDVISALRSVGAEQVVVLSGREGLDAAQLGVLAAYNKRDFHAQALVDVLNATP